MSSQRNRNVVKKLLLVMVACLIGGGVWAADELEMNFKNPPESAKPWVFWIWMNGNITREGITADLEAMQRVGIGGVELFNVNTTTPRGPVDFMSPAWHELVQHAISEAGRLRMRMAMMNCGGWSSSGGPWVKPEEAMQMLAWTDLRVRGPARFSKTLPQAEFEQRLYTTGFSPGYPRGTEPLKPVGSRFYRDIAVLAFPTPRDEPEVRSKRLLSLKETLELNSGKGTPSMPIPKGTVIDLTSRLQADGRLDWDVPEGQWTLLRLGHTPTDQCNMPAPPGGEGLECDKLSPRGLQAVWDGLMKGIIHTAGPRAGKAFSGVLIDSWEVGLQHWSPAFAAEFTKRRGYDPTPWLPVLSGREVESGELSNRFLWDMRRTVSDLIADNYFGELTRLCHAHGLTSISETYGGPFDAVQAGGRVDIPMGEFWAGKSENPVPGEMAGTCKLAASSAHGYGKPMVAAEAFTARPNDSRWSNTPYSLKIRGDWAFCQGINRYVFHRYAHQPWLGVSPGMTMGPYGINFERSNTWWEQSRAWLSYIARCQFLLQQGRFVADVAYLPGDLAPPHRQLRKIPFDVPGHDFDILSPELVLQMRMVGNRLTLPSGMSYKALVVDGDGSLQAVLVEKMRELALAGAVISCPRPTLSPSLRDYPAGDARIEALAKELWDGKRISTTNAPTLLKEAGILPDFEGPVQFTHRQTPDADIYFLAHPVRKPLDCTALFRVSGSHAEIWHPDTGAIEPATVVGSRTDGRTELALQFDPAGSFFVVFRKQPSDSAAKYPLAQRSLMDPQSVENLTGPWTVEFPPKLGAPASVTLDSLMSLSEHATAGVRYFSGTATYSKSFEMPDGKVPPGTRQILDLGGVENIAEVFVNGVNLGILWKPPFAVDITNATKPGTNRLEVRVTNQWINRLIGDEQEASDVEWCPGDQGLTLKELPEWFVTGKPRPSAGRIGFTTFKLYEKDSSLVKSGLLGPVTLRFAKRVGPKE